MDTIPVDTSLTYDVQPGRRYALVLSAPFSSTAEVVMLSKVPDETGAPISLSTPYILPDQTDTSLIDLTDSPDSYTAEIVAATSQIRVACPTGGPLFCQLTPIHSN
jgi:hypothetical protein